MKDVFVLLLLTTIFLVHAQAQVCRLCVIPQEKFVSVPGGNAMFTCLSSSYSCTITAVQWLVNGTQLENQDLHNVTEEFSGRVGRLTFKNIPMIYNTTRIRCSAMLSNERTAATNDAVLLLLQGRLSAVASLAVTIQEDSTTLLTWIAPFSLDIIDNDPDITYCVDVLDLASNSLLRSKCEINATNISYPVPTGSECSITLFTVTTVNLNGNGSQATVPFLGTESRPNRVVELISSRSDDGSSNKIDIVLTMNAPVCGSKLTFTDRDVPGTFTKLEPDRTHASNNITFNTEQLTTNRRYTVTVEAYNVAGRAEYDIIISTHDVERVNVSIYGTEVKTVYFEHSDATGALLSFVFITGSGDVDFNKSALLALDRNTSYNYTLPFDLHRGRYKVYVYDIEQDGTLSSGVGYPADIKEFFTTENGQGEMLTLPGLEGCQVGADVYTIMVQCTYSSNFQVIAQLNTDSDDMRKLYVNQSIDLQTPVTVPVESVGEYQVSIFSVSEDLGQLNSTVQYKKQVVVSGLPSTTTAISTVTTTSTTSTVTVPTTSTTTTTSTPSTSNIGWLAVIVLPLIILVIVVIMIIVYKRSSGCLSLETQHTVQSPGTQHNGTVHKDENSNKVDKYVETSFVLGGPHQWLLLAGAAPHENGQPASTDNEPAQSSATEQVQNGTAAIKSRTPDMSGPTQVVSNEMMSTPIINASAANETEQTSSASSSVSSASSKNRPMASNRVASHSKKPEFSGKAVVLVDTSELDQYYLHDVQKTGNILGRGSYGTVEELVKGGTLYAGKVLHPVLGVENMLKKIKLECHLLADLRHPNIVQFMGICVLSDSEYPILVMEKMDTSLDALLDSHEQLQQSIEISTKFSILLDVSKALVYLHHGRKNDPIVHRDLTARNVLLDTNLNAKIADVGNARESIDESRTLTEAPGTAAYMPPEAFGIKPDYTTSLDIFSFGHLTLYTITQVFPKNLNSSTYNDPNTRKLVARSELERREKYMELLEEKLGSDHALLHIVKLCLSNNEERRPTAMDIMENLKIIRSSTEHSSASHQRQSEDYTDNEEKK